MHASRQAMTFPLTQLCVATLLATGLGSFAQGAPLEPNQPELFGSEAVKDGANKGIFVDTNHPFLYNQQTKTWAPQLDTMELVRAGIHSAYINYRIPEYNIPAPQGTVTIGEGLEHIVIRTTQKTLNPKIERLMRFGIANESQFSNTSSLAFVAPTYISLEGKTINHSTDPLIATGVFQDTLMQAKGTGTNATSSFKDLYIKADGLNLSQDKAGYVAGVHNASTTDVDTSFSANDLWVAFSGTYDVSNMQEDGAIRLVGFDADKTKGANVINGRMRVDFGDVPANDRITRQGMKIVDSHFTLKGDLDAGSVGTAHESAVIVAAGTKTNEDTQITIHQMNWDHTGERWLLVTGPSTVTLEENQNLIKGDLVERLAANHNPVLNLNFQGEGKGLEGAMKVEGQGQAQHNLSFTQGAHWTIHGEDPLTKVNRLNLDHATVSFANHQADHKILAHDFHADNHSVVFMNMDVAGKHNDQLEITGPASGQLQLSIVFANDTNADQTYTNWLVKSPIDQNLTVTNTDGGFSFANGWHLALVSNMSEETLKNAKPYDISQPTHGGYWVLVKQPKEEQKPEETQEPEKPVAPAEPNTSDRTTDGNTDKNHGENTDDKTDPNANGNNGGKTDDKTDPNANGNNGGKTDDKTDPNANGNNGGKTDDKTDPNANGNNGGQTDDKTDPNANGNNGEKTDDKTDPNANGNNDGKTDDKTDANGNTDGNPHNNANGNNNAAAKDPYEVLQNIASSAAMGSLWFSDLNDVRTRLGEIRQSKNEGIWTTFTTETERFSRNGQSIVKSHAQQVSVGVDHHVTSSMGDWFFGAAFKQSASRAHGLNEAKGARVKSRSVSLKAYGTLLTQSGAYVDLVAQVGMNRQELNGTANDAVSGFAAAYRQWGVGASVEVGHQLSLGSSWFIEPQAQMSIYHVPSKTFDTTTGIHASMDAVNFLTGRVGVVLGQHALNTDTHRLQWAGIAGVKYEFLGKQDVTYTANNTAMTREALSMRGARVYYGVQSSYQAGQHWRLYGTLQREDGHNYHKSYRLDLGMRWTF